MDKDEYIKNLERLEQTQDILNAVIHDLTCGSNAIGECIDVMKNPIDLLFSNNIDEDINNILNKSYIYFLMAANKIEKFNELMKDFSNEGRDEE